MSELNVRRVRDSMETVVVVEGHEDTIIHVRGDESTNLTANNFDLSGHSSLTGAILSNNAAVVAGVLEYIISTTTASVDNASCLNVESANVSDSVILAASSNKAISINTIEPSSLTGASPNNRSLMDQDNTTDVNIETRGTSDDNDGNISDECTPVGGKLAALRATNSHSGSSGVRKRKRLRRGNEVPTESGEACKRRKESKSKNGAKRIIPTLVSPLTEVRTHDDGTPMYRIHKLVNHKVVEKVLYFEVSWTSYLEASNNTWQSEKTLLEDGCEDYINSYQESLKAGQKRRLLIAHSPKNGAKHPLYSCFMLAINKAAELCGLNNYVTEKELSFLISEKVILNAEQGIPREKLQLIKAKLWQYRRRNNIHQQNGSLDFGGKDQI